MVSKPIRTRFRLSLKSSSDPRQRLFRRILLLATALIITALYPTGTQFEYRYDLNEITSEAIIAPFNFPILKNQRALERERQQARDAVPDLFRHDQQLLTTQLNGVVDLFTRAKRIRRSERKLAQSRDRAYRYRYDARITEALVQVKRDSTELTGLNKNFSMRFPLDLNSAHWHTFFKGQDIGGRILDYERLQSAIERVIRDVIGEGILEIPKSQLRDKIAVVREGVEEQIEVRYMLDLDQAWARGRTRFQMIFPSNLNVENAIATELLVYFIQPNYHHDNETTLRRQQEAVDRVPISKGIVLRNERLVDANTRVTEEVLEKFNSLAAAQSKLLASAGGIQLWLPRIGLFLITCILLTFFFAWLYVYRRDWYKQTRVIMLTNLLFILLMGAANLFHARLGLSEYILPLTVAAMAFTILFDARTGIIANITMTLMVGFLVGNKVDFVLINLLAGSVAIYAVRNLRSRRQIFTAMIYIISAYVVGITSVEFLKYISFSTLGYHLMYAGINGVLSPILVYGLIGVLEVLFGITTNLTLLELSDFNHPLLRRLAREANGTFSHSIVVGNLVEAAANVIGAKSLLCRVGAYYHDIGKIVRPEYFIENQFHQQNPHDTLAPHLSVKVVIAHVRDGLALAREYGVPEGVAQFIPMHHGTARLEYFYQRALNESENKSDVREELFRYGGPRANTKETGLLMLCEAIEAATRSIKKPTLPRIQQMIEKIIELRIEDGQLDECPLTLRELKMIQGDPRAGTGIISVLQGIYHVRMPYPSTESVAEGPAAPEEIVKETLFESTATE